MPYNFSGKIAQRRSNRLDAIVNRKLAAAGANFASADRGARRSAIGPNQVSPTAVKPLNQKVRAGRRALLEIRDTKMGAKKNAAKIRY